jgi:hypothetical protein
MNSIPSFARKTALLTVIGYFCCLRTDPHCSLKINNSSGDVKERHCQLQLVNNQVRFIFSKIYVGPNDELSRYKI